MVHLIELCKYLLSQPSFKAVSNIAILCYFRSPSLISDFKMSPQYFGDLPAHKNSADRSLRSLIKSVLGLEGDRSIWVNLDTSGDLMIVFFLVPHTN